MEKGSDKASTATGTFHFLSRVKSLWAGYHIAHTAFCASKTINTNFLETHSATLLLQCDDVYDFENFLSDNVYMSWLKQKEIIFTTPWKTQKTQLSNQTSGCPRCFCVLRGQPLCSSCNPLSSRKLATLMGPVGVGNHTRPWTFARETRKLDGKCAQG